MKGRSMDTQCTVIYENDWNGKPSLVRPGRGMFMFARMFVSVFRRLVPLTGLL